MSSAILALAEVPTSKIDCTMSANAKMFGWDGSIDDYKLPGPQLAEKVPNSALFEQVERIMGGEQSQVNCQGAATTPRWRQHCGRETS